MITDEERVTLVDLQNVARTQPDRLTDKAWQLMAELEKKALPKTSMGERLLIGAGRGALDLYQGIKQGALQAGEAMGLVDEGRAEDYRQEVNRDLAEYEKLSAAYPWSTGVGRFGGNVASAPIPGFQGSILGRLGKTAAASGLLGGAEYGRHAGGARSDGGLWPGRWTRGAGPG